MQSKKGSIFGATLLVTGTSVGGGILALPVATGDTGFFPSAFIMLISWVLMTITALYLVELTLAMPPGSHFITIAAKFLGPLGKALAWILYLFVGFASLVAYSAGGGILLAQGIKIFLKISLSQAEAIVLFVFLFGSVVYLGNVIIGKINAIFMVGLVLSYFMIIFLIQNHMSWDYLVRSNWKDSLIALPLLLTIFSFQSIVPSLVIYLKQDVKALKISIIVGTTSALLIYLIWQGAVLGTLGLEGEYSLAQARVLGIPITSILGNAVNSKYLQTAADFFAFFALTTSFFGIALGLYDFLADGLKISRGKKGKLSLGLLIAVPTLFFALRLERVFLLALDASGGIGDSLLNGILPASMLWSCRYYKQVSSPFHAPGEKKIIVIIFLLALFVLAIELLGKLGVVPTL